MGQAAELQRVPDPSAGISRGPALVHSRRPAAWSGLGVDCAGRRSLMLLATTGTYCTVVHLGRSGYDAEGA